MPSLPAMAATGSSSSSNASPMNTSAWTAALLVLAQRMPEHAADLRQAALAVDLVHQLRQLFAARHPFGGTTFLAAVINKLDIKLPDRCRLRGTSWPADRARWPRSALGSPWRRARTSGGRAASAGF